MCTTRTRLDFPKLDLGECSIKHRAINFLGCCCAVPSYIKPMDNKQHVLTLMPPCFPSTLLCKDSAAEEDRSLTGELFLFSLEILPLLVEKKDEL